MEQLRGLYPAYEPYDSGLLDTGDGHQIYWSSAAIRRASPRSLFTGGQGAGLHLIIGSYSTLQNIM